MVRENLMGQIQVVIERLDHLKTAVTDIKSSMSKLENHIEDKVDKVKADVTQNTAARNKQTVINLILGVVGAALVTAVVTLIFSSF